MENNPDYDEDMDARLAKLEQDVTALMADAQEMLVDLKVLQKTSATKQDIAEATASIIMWVVAAVLLGQLVPAMTRLLF